jgi:DNA-binding MarR family transcriptional regulator
MTLTRRYSRVHRAIREGAKSAGVRPTTIRVLLALEERGGEVTGHDALAMDLSMDGGDVREGLSALYRAGLAERKRVARGVDEGRGAKPAHVKLTQAGRLLAGQVRAAAGVKQ